MDTPILLVSVSFTFDMAGHPHLWNQDWFLRNACWENIITLSPSKKKKKKESKIVAVNVVAYEAFDLQFGP